MPKKKQAGEPNVVFRVDAKLLEELKKEAAAIRPSTTLSGYIRYLLITHPGRIKS